MIEFKLPALGENIEQGDLVRLMVAPGATVSEGQAVMELETDKAVVEVPSSVSGVVKDVKVKEGDKIKVGQTIFTADSNGAPSADHMAEKSSAADPQATPAEAPAPCRRRSCPRPAGSRSTASRRSPARVSHG